MSIRRAFSGQVADADIKLMRVFKTIVECGGFSAAQVELNISRSAISIHVATLERRLGLRLCQRGRSGFSLTDAGHQVYQASHQVLASLESFKTEVNAIHTRLRGELNIGLTDNLVTIPHMFISNALLALKAQGPQVRINIRMVSPNEIERGVLDGSLQMGAVPALRQLPGLNMLALYDEVSLLYCAHNHPLFHVDTSGLSEKIVSKADAVAPAFAQTAQTRSIQQFLNTTASANSRDGVAFLVLSGAYIGYLPAHFAQQWVDRGQMKALNPELFRYQTRFNAIMRKDARPNLVLDTFNELLVEEIKRAGPVFADESTTLA